MQLLEQLFQDAKSLARSSPGDLSARSTLWQVFAARGEFDRARKQLDIISDLDSSWLIEVQACHGLIAAEEQHLAVFGGTLAPVCLGEPPPWFVKVVAALPLLAQGSSEDALSLLREVRDMNEALPGVLNGQPFEWACDGDARVGPCLEVIVQGRYLWVPWSAVQMLDTRPPTEIRDHLWQPAMLQVTEEGPIEAFIPVRYTAPANESQAMSRSTDWAPLDDEMFMGFGQKCLVTDSLEAGYLDIRSLTFRTRH
jgi:type VI secretion system protein ImpE